MDDEVYVTQVIAEPAEEKEISCEEFCEICLKDRKVQDVVVRLVTLMECVKEGDDTSHLAEALAAICAHIAGNVIINQWEDREGQAWHFTEMFGEHLKSHLRAARKVQKDSSLH